MLSSPIKSKPGKESMTYSPIVLKYRKKLFKNILNTKSVDHSLEKYNQSWELLNGGYRD